MSSAVVTVVSADVVVTVDIASMGTIVVVAIVVVVVSCLSLSRISMTDSVLVEVAFWLTPDKVSFKGNSRR